MDNLIHRKNYRDNKYYEDGIYKIVGNKFLFKQSQGYEFDECKNISNSRYYDEVNAKETTITNTPDLFGSNILHILISKKYQRLIAISTNEEALIKSYKYSPSVSSEDVTEIISNIRYSRIATT